MPDQPTNTEPEEGTEPVELCEDCSNPQAECECVTCEICYYRGPDGCECPTCNCCSKAFNLERGQACQRCGYCHSCISSGRVNHPRCPSCRQCQSEDDYNCSNCGCYECCATFRCREDDCSQCVDCCGCEARANTDSEFIERAFFQDYPESVPRESTVPGTFLYLGVECETEADDEARLHPIAKAIHEKHAHEILMKEDGSLDHGIELVTGKYSLDAHKALWPNLCTTAVQAGLRSWKHKSTGIHVHMSRLFFTPLDIGKLLVFINSEQSAIRLNIQRIAGRSSNNYAKVSCKKLTDGNKSENRYEAVNLTNERTIEIRIFKGTLKASHILADVEFCHALAYWVKEASIQEIETWSSYRNYVLKHRKLYKNLIELMENTAEPSEA